MPRNATQAQTRRAELEGTVASYALYTDDVREFRSSPVRMDHGLRCYLRATPTRTGRAPAEARRAAQRLANSKGYPTYLVRQTWAPGAQTWIETVEAKFEPRP